MFSLIPLVAASWLVLQQPFLKKAAAAEQACAQEGSLILNIRLQEDAGWSPCPEQKSSFRGADLDYNARIQRLQQLETRVHDLQQEVAVMRKELLQSVPAREIRWIVVPNLLQDEKSWPACFPLAPYSHYGLWGGGVSAYRFEVYPF